MKKKIAAILICVAVIFGIVAIPASAYSHDDPLIIVLDPGHGGVDSGALAPTFNSKTNPTACEKYINLKIAKACKAELEKNRDVKVYLTRSTYDLSDVPANKKEGGKLTLTNRGLLAGEKKAKVLISIHCNSSTSNNVRGAEVWAPINVSWCPSAYTVGQNLGAKILNRLSGLGIANRGVHTRVTTLPQTEKYPDGSLMDYYTVINSARSVKVPALIVEHAYINNINDYNAFLSTDAKLANIGKADAQAIMDYFGGTSTPKYFNDVYMYDGWYCDAVKYVKTNKYFSGYANGNFGPMDRMQRQDFVVVLANMNNIDLTQYNKPGKYKDVKTGTYYNAAVNWATEAGLISGYMNGYFGVGDSLTREQMVTIFHRYAEKFKKVDVTPVNEKAKSYPDYQSVSEYAKEAMVWAIDRGLISGNDGKWISPQAIAQRCQLAQVLMNADGNLIFDATKYPPKPNPEEIEGSGETE